MNKRLGNKLVIAFILCLVSSSCSVKNSGTDEKGHIYNGSYTGKNLDRIAFPIGGIGAGMFCLDGTGSISHMSVRNKPDVFNEPCMFAALSVKGVENGTRILEGKVPDWKKFGKPGSANGSESTTYGFPRFNDAKFTARFPYATIELHDEAIPVDVTLSGWSPFVPTDADNSSLPVGAVEYTFKNRSSSKIDAVFSYNSRNFMQQAGGLNRIRAISNGFILSEDGVKDKPETKGDFAFFTSEPSTVVDHCWFRGGWWDPLTITWETIMKGESRNTDPVEKDAPGASLYVPFTLEPGATRVIRLMMSWYVPDSDLRYGEEPKNKKDEECTDPACSCKDPFYKPWYSKKLSSIEEVASYWKTNYNDLNAKSSLFRDSFFNTTLPPEVVEAISANLSILKSPTVLRQPDGRLWSWEGCGDSWGCCAGSCQHVWNYAQAIPHLFPSLERTLRETEYFHSQDTNGHQTFRSALPIRPVANTFHAAAVICTGLRGRVASVYLAKGRHALAPVRIQQRSLDRN